MRLPVRTDHIAKGTVKRDRVAHKKEELGLETFGREVWHKGLAQRSDL